MSSEKLSVALVAPNEKSKRIAFSAKANATSARELAKFCPCSLPAPAKPTENVAFSGNSILTGGDKSTIACVATAKHATNTAVSLVPRSVASIVLAISTTGTLRIKIGVLVGATSHRGPGGGGESSSQMSTTTSVSPNRIRFTMVPSHHHNGGTLSTTSQALEHSNSALLRRRGDTGTTRGDTMACSHFESESPCPILVIRTPVCRENSTSDQL
mmetsp:Transcript_10346/g.26305  ORF Transcript_10346/g.26305 Transcript_10346/m.26305 type:complete len:214 (-) Transcript_10346:2269-2910(-)